MTAKSETSLPRAAGESSVRQLVRWMTVGAWVALLTGLTLSLIDIGHFSEQNATLMVGIGLMVGSVHIYVIRTAIHLVHARQLRPLGGGGEQA